MQPFIHKAHRDDHRIFILQVAGSSRMMVDFREVEANGTGAYFILPGQVHHGIGTFNAELWFVAVDRSNNPIIPAVLPLFAR